MLKMNTSFSKYVKQCKWGLSLDAAGSDYSAHNNLGASARTQCSALGGEPFPRGRAAALGSRHLRWRRLAGKCRRVGGGGRGGCWEGLLTLYFPPREDIPAGLGGRGRGVGGGPAPQHPLALGHPRKVSRLSNNLTS